MEILEFLEMIKKMRLEKFEYFIHAETEKGKLLVQSVNSESDHFIQQIAERENMNWAETKAIGKIPNYFYLHFF